MPFRPCAWSWPSRCRSAAATRYSATRLGRTFAFTATPGVSRAGSAASRKAEEARAIHEHLPGDVRLVALDERGKAIDSHGFAQQLIHWRDDGRAGVAFVIGGADGLDPDFVARADLTLSFSPLTWPHQLVRIMLAEQLYRATTILSGHPYHRE